MQEADPLNLFRITWKNEPVEHGGGFNHGNWIEFPQAITGVDATVVGIVGNWFPTGAHKVGAAYGCLVPRIVTGQFDPTTQKAKWSYLSVSAWPGARILPRMEPRAPTSPSPLLWRGRPAAPPLPA